MQVLTLLRMIAGLTPATSGEIRIAGRKVGSVQDGIGMVFKEPSLLSWLTGMGNVLVACSSIKHSSAQCEAQALRLLTAMGISHCADQHPASFSPGLAQRVSICRALALNPSILLMDDPFCCLDGVDREQMILDIQRLRLTPGTTVVLCTTCVNEAILLSDRVAVLGRDGRILQTVAVELPRPRRMDKATAPLITEYCNNARTALHAAGILA